MKLTVLQENFKNAVSLTSHFTSPKAQLPILGNILLKADKSKLTLSATNLEISIKTDVAAKVVEEGEITVNGRTLNDIISNLSSGSLELESIKEQIKITSGKFKSNILGVNSADFPILPNDSIKNLVSIESNDLIVSLQKVLFAVSTDETRPILTGVLFIFRNNKLSLVATDGFRLSEVKIKSEILVDDIKIIIPKTILYELSKVDIGKKIDFSFDKESNQVIFKIGNTTLSSRIIEGDFPDYEKIIPTTSELTIDVDKQELEKSIKLASIFARDSGKIVRLKILNNELKVTAESSASGNQETILEINNEEKEMIKEKEIMFNYSFIEDVLKVIANDEIKIAISADNKASKFLDSKSPNFMHIIMPIKTT